jgi:RND family efflux transporter MFP subunit
MKSSSSEAVRPFRALAWALLVIAVAGAGACKQPPPAAPPPPPKEIEVLTMQPSEVRQTGEYLGSLLSRGSVMVLPQVAGYVRAVLVKPGQKVAVGAPLIEVDAREESAALASAQAQQASAQANLVLAKQVRDRTEALQREGLATAEELDQRKASAAAAEAAAQAALAQVTQRRVAVQFFSVRAAVAGVVGDVLVRVGDFVTASTRATTISQSGALEISIAVPAPRARGVAVGTPVELLREDGSVQVVTSVFFVSPDVDRATQLVEIKASVPATEGLRSSEVVRARVVYATSQALQVPSRAVLRQSGQSFVYVVTEKGGREVVERRPVELGELGTEAFVLVKGLAAGERIALTAIQALRDGAPVKLKGSSAPAAPAGAVAPPPLGAASGAPPGASPGSSPGSSPPGGGGATPTTSAAGR